MGADDEGKMMWRDDSNAVVSPPLVVPPAASSRRLVSPSPPATEGLELDSADNGGGRYA